MNWARGRRRKKRQKKREIPPTPPTHKLHQFILRIRLHLKKGKKKRKWGVGKDREGTVL